MELTSKKCGICGKNGSKLQSNLMTLKTKYSGTFVYQLLERFVEYEFSEQASILEKSAACVECCAKLNDYDAAYTKALIIQKELLDLLKNSSLGIFQDYERLEGCDVDDEQDSDWQSEVKSEHLEEQSQEAVVAEPEEIQTSLKSVKVNFATAVSLKCNICGKKFSKINDMKYHKHSDNAMGDTALPSTSKPLLFIEADVESPEAAMAETFSEELEEDFAEHPVDIEYATPSLDDATIEYFVEELEEEETESDGKPPAKKNIISECYYCDLKFSFKRDFHEHLERQHSYEQGHHKCKICGFFAKTRAALSSHFGRHSRPPLMCPVCNKKFSQKGSLQRHMPIHTGEKVFNCKLCGKGYIHYSSFYMHQLAHKNIREKKCAICGYMLLSSSHLSRHMRTHSGEKPFECPECGQKFSQRYNMVSHLNSHKGKARKSGKTFECDMCQEIFERKVQLKIHVQQAHNTSNETAAKKQPTIMQ